MIKTKRTYDKPQAEEGFMILVDRICPRGIKITDVQMDLWQKYISPSILLGKWYKHDESKLNEFKKIVIIRNYKTREILYYLVVRKSQKRNNNLTL